jgi:protein-tyrosine phosphatase
MKYSEFISKIDDDLYLGSWYATKKCVLKEYKIKTVISIGCLPYSEPQKGIEYFYFDLKDNIQSSDKLFQEILPKIFPILLNGQNCLVHCSAGKSRSVTIIAAYLIKYKGMTSKNALKYIKRQRSCVKPNKGFVNGLEKLI